MKSSTGSNSRKANDMKFMYLIFLTGFCAGAVWVFVLGMIFALDNEKKEKKLKQS
jgi:hypothetical protein